MKTTIIGFFKTEKLAKIKIEYLISSKLDGDNSTYFIEKSKDNHFVVYGEINFSKELKKELKNLI